jgi:peptidoglycan/LPS O-acetylase OafA/YrhL
MTRLVAATYLLISAVGTGAYLVRQRRPVLACATAPLQWFGRVHLVFTGLALAAVIFAVIDDRSLADSMTELAAAGVGTAIVTAVAVAALRRAASDAGGDQ